MFSNVPIRLLCHSSRNVHWGNGQRFLPEAFSPLHTHILSMIIQILYPWLAIYEYDVGGGFFYGEKSYLDNKSRGYHFLSVLTIRLDVLLPLQETKEFFFWMVCFQFWNARDRRRSYFVTFCLDVVIVITIHGYTGTLRRGIDVGGWVLRRASAIDC